MANLILIPGFWLDASAWDDIAPGLKEAAHQVRALTLPGLESRDSDRRNIGMRDHIAAVVSAVDETEGQVVLVGHSAGGAIAHATADARPGRIARIVYVDTFPLGDGQAVNDELPVVDGEIPLPDWSAFPDEDLEDLDDDLREQLRARAIPQPAATASDRQVLVGDRRYDVPTTVIACEFTSEQMKKWIANGEEMVAELGKMRDVEYVELPTGHWPQFTKPKELTEAILTAVGS